MQGVQVAPALNDENSVGQQGLLQQFKQQQSSSSSSGMPLQAVKQGSVLKSARKALGNITNQAQARGSEGALGQQSAGKPSAIKPAQQQRRAFGDITNSAAKPPAGSAGAFTTLLKKQDHATSTLPAQQQQQKQQQLGGSSRGGSAEAQAAVQPASSSSSGREWWEGLEPERPAGKTWEQLEAERWAQLEADADASANSILAGLRACTASFLAPPAAPADSDGEDDAALADFGPLRLPPSWVQASAAAPEPPQASLEQLLLVDADLASLLPDIPLPDGDTRAPEPEADAADEAAEQQEQEQQTDVCGGAGPGGAMAAHSVEASCGSPPPVGTTTQSATGMCSPDPTPW